MFGKIDKEYLLRSVLDSPSDWLRVASMGKLSQNCIIRWIVRSFSKEACGIRRFLAIVGVVVLFLLSHWALHKLHCWGAALCRWYSESKILSLSFQNLLVVSFCFFLITILVCVLVHRRSYNRKSREETLPSNQKIGRASCRERV